jgi:hypothetical protein
MKIFYGKENIMVQLSDGGRKLIPKYYLEVYFGVDKSQIKDKHVKQFLNIK